MCFYPGLFYIEFCPIHCYGYHYINYSNFYVNPETLQHVCGHWQYKSFIRILNILITLK